MKKMVLAVAADTHGSMTILNEYYHKALHDKENDWVFVISRPKLENAENIEVVRMPWIKNSWFHRMFFNHFRTKGLVNRYKVDEVISLQNTLVPRSKVKQTLYLQQTLHFSDKKFGLLRYPRLWTYQNVIGKMIDKSTVKADKVIVQTEWLKNTCVDKFGLSASKFEVVKPEVFHVISNKYKARMDDMTTFFYPSNGWVYKNHQLIVETAKELKVLQIDNYEVILTLTGTENKDVSELLNEVKKYNLPIRFVGTLNLEEVFNYYTSSTLIFPSYIESFGLPLLEASMHGAPILASDCPFSREILEGYNQVEFFNPFDDKELLECMKEHLQAKYT